MHTRRSFLKVSAVTAVGGLIEPSPALHAFTAEKPEDVRAFETKMKRARPVPLMKVRVTGGPLKNAQDVTARYLLELEPDRMLAFYRMRAGLSQKAQPYG